VENFDSRLNASFTIGADPRRVMEPGISMKPMEKQFAANGLGATSIEYGLIAASVAFAIIASVTALFYAASEAIVVIQ
jgi:Flp pilus assembly pilin Flp